MQEVQNPILREIQQLPDEIIELKQRGMKNILAALVVGAIFIVAAIIIVRAFSLNYSERVITASLFIIGYAIILFFFLEKRTMKEIHHREVHQYETPVVHHVIKERPIIREVEKPVIREVQKTIFVATPPKTQARSAYVGSSQTRTFHRRSCRFAGMIKKEYLKEENNSVWFERRGYKRCEECLRLVKTRK